MLFATNNTVKIDLDENQWLELKKEIPYKAIAHVFQNMEKPDAQTSTNAIIETLKAGLVNWDLLDDKGEQIPFDIALIDQLTFSGLGKIAPIITDLYFLDKKKLNQSEES